MTTIETAHSNGETPYSEMLFLPDLVEAEEAQVVERRLRLQHELDGDEGGQPRGHPPELSPLAPANPVDGDEHREHLEVRREGDRPGRSDRQQQRHERLRLADRDRPHDRQRGPAGHQEDRFADAQAKDRERSRGDDDRRPDERSRFIQQEGQRPEGDQRGVADSDRRPGRWCRPPGRRAAARIRSGACVVVGTHVGKRILGEVEDRGLDAEDDPEHRGKSKDDPDGRSGIDGHVRRG